jgi:serralysin
VPLSNTVPDQANDDNPSQQSLATRWQEGRNPSAPFDTNDYLAAYPDVKAAGIDPLLHYIQPGMAEGRQVFSV